MLARPLSEWYMHAYYHTCRIDAPATSISAAPHLPDGGDSWIQKVMSMHHQGITGYTQFPVCIIRYILLEHSGSKGRKNRPCWPGSTYACNSTLASSSASISKFLIITCRCPLRTCWHLLPKLASKLLTLNIHTKHTKHRTYSIMFELTTCMYKSFSCNHRWYMIDTGHTMQE
jgi:hypothetical protein